jgi:starch-binding outer membrane protein, SusD/RagB family
MTTTKTTMIRRASLVALLLMACSPEKILDVQDPDIIDPENANSPSGAIALHAGAVGEFSFAIVGDNGGTEGQILVGGLMTDEFMHSGTFPTRLEFEQRKALEDNGTLTGVFRNLQRARWLAEEAIPKLRDFAPAPASRVAEMFALSGLSYVFAAETYCSGVPFSDPDGTPPEGVPLTTNEMLDTAIVRFDSSLAVTADSSVAIRSLARVGRARALLNKGDFAGAAAAVAGVPDTFVYRTTHTTTTGRQQNGIHVFNWLSERWSVADTQGTNGLDFRSAADPRVVSMRDTVGTGVGFDAATPQWNLQKFPARTTPVPIATGLEARLIEAEALLTSDPTGWLAILNNLRATRIAPALPALADPVTQVAREDLHFRERAFWLFATGHRLGDLRRLIRQYNRTEDGVFPTGLHFKGGLYGDDVNLPVPFSERNNPNFTGCLNRDA